MPTFLALPPSSALSLRLAADPRLTETDYVDDQIWELALGGGEPPALALETSYGLRARSMRLYPSFRWGGATRANPKDFTEPPRVEVALPNYLRLKYDPFVDLQVQAEYWAVDSKLIAGRLTFLSRAEAATELRFRLHGQLRPEEGGQPMAEVIQSGVSVLSGRTGSLRPLLFLSGGAVADNIAHPALTVKARLRPGAPQRLFWAAAGQASFEAGFQAAREIVSSDWEKEIARLERTNGRWVRIESGNADWDTALAMTQRVGLGALVSGTSELPNTSFVLNRGPDSGYSVGGRGRDYEGGWAGQDPFGALLLARQLLPVAPKEVTGFLRNFIHVQMGSGEIDGKPGLAGQRGGWLCPPILATLALAIHHQTESRALLREVIDPLHSFFNAWFRKRHDRDGDGTPEWSHPLQTSLPESPTFVPWASWGLGLDLHTVESPELVALLLEECTSLMAMAKELDRTEMLPDLEAKATGLRRGLARCWRPENGRYGLIDRDLHQPLAGDMIGEGQGEFVLEVGEKFEPMARLLVRSEGPEGASRGLRVTVHGRGPKGQFRTERIDETKFRWFWTLGTATSENTFASIQKVEVRGLTEEFRTEIRIADHRRAELSHHLPLWAGGIDPAHEEQIIERHLLADEFWRPFGLPAFPSSDPTYDAAERVEACGVRILMNELMGEALLRAGRREAAASLVTKLMEAASKNLRERRSFWATYNPEEGWGAGERGSILGLAPLHLFLQVLGVRLISPWSVEVSGRNPFPWPVTVHWRELSVHRPREGPTRLTFPDGREVELAGEERRRVEARR